MRGDVRAFKSGDMSPHSKAPSLKQSFFTAEKSDNHE
jgi:hypothetical protein